MIIRPLWFGRLPEITISAPKRAQSGRSPRLRLRALQISVTLPIPLSFLQLRLSQTAQADGQRLVARCRLEGHLEVAARMSGPQGGVVKRVELER